MDYSTGCWKKNVSFSLFYTKHQTCLDPTTFTNGDLYIRCVMTCKNNYSKEDCAGQHSSVSLGMAFTQSGCSSIAQSLLVEGSHWPAGLRTLLFGAHYDYLPCFCAWTIRLNTGTVSSVESTISTINSAWSLGVHFQLLTLVCFKL